MRNLHHLLLGGLACATLALPTAAQQRGPRQAPPAPELDARQPGARPDGPRLHRPDLHRTDLGRALILERFDKDGDGRLSAAEAAEARRWHREHLAAREGQAPRRLRPFADPPGTRSPGAQAQPVRPGLERLRERARSLPPEERALLRQRLAERFRERQQLQEHVRPFHRPTPHTRPDAQRRGQHLRPVPPQRRGPGAQQGRPSQRHAPQLQRRGRHGQEPAPARPWRR